MTKYRFLPTRNRASTVVIASLVCLGSAFALDPAQLKPQGYVSDFAQALDPAAKAQLESYCGQVEQATGAQIAVVTISSLEGAPVEDFANDLFRKWGIGKKGKDEGVLLLLAVNDHKDRVEVGYGLEPILPDGFVGSVLREMSPSLKEGNYAQALLAGTAAIGDHIASAKGVTLTRTLPRRGPPPDRDGGGGLPWPLILIGIAVLFGLFGRGGRGGGGFLGWMLLGSILGSGRYRDGGGGWGGGGFGGSDGGGGGFGGFGGGDSGGGGASGSW